MCVIYGTIMVILERGRTCQYEVKRSDLGFEIQDRDVMSRSCDYSVTRLQGAGLYG
jgi:hypothetical protein